MSSPWTPGHASHGDTSARTIDDSKARRKWLEAWEQRIIVRRLPTPVKASALPRGDFQSLAGGDRLGTRVDDR